MGNISEYELFHVTIPEAPRLLQLTTNFASVTTYDPDTSTTSQGPYPNLMRRYKFVHVARSAGTIGILVNTLSLSNTKQLINTIKDKIKIAGKNITSLLLVSQMSPNWPILKVLIFGVFWVVIIKVLLLIK